MHVRDLDADDLPGIAALVASCLAEDGGLPMAATEPLVRSMYLSGPARGWFDRDTLVAVGGVRVDDADGSATVAGCVSPDRRGAGLGSAVVEWTLEVVGDRPTTVRSETATDAADRLLARHGFRPVFGELLLRHDLASVTPAVLPDGVSLQTWSTDTARTFHSAYAASFADRPGFPAWPAERWIDWTVDEEFLPDLSLVAIADGTPVGFVTTGEGWVVQTGVAPGWRRRGLAAALLGRALDGLRRAGFSQCLLAVATDNPPAEALYRRTGFVDAGRRARYRRG